jgi:hypothetical protein
MSSRLIQVTVVPTGTVNVCGRKLKLSIVTTLGAGFSPAVDVWMANTISVMAPA